MDLRDVRGAGHPHLLVSGDAGGAGPWSAAYIPSVGQDVQRLNTLEKLTNEFQQIAIPQLVLLHFGKPASDLVQFAGVLDKIDWHFPTDKTAYHGLLVWIDDPATLTQDSVGRAPQLPMVTRYQGGTLPVALTNPERQPLMPLQRQDANNLFVAATAPVELGLNDAKDALRLSSSGHLYIAPGGTAAEPQRPIAEIAGAIEIPMTGPESGCLKFGGQLCADTTALGVGFEYSWTQANAATPRSGSLRYPLLARPDGLAGRSVSACLAIRAPLDPVRTYWALHPGTVAAPGTSNPLRSAFRTILNDPIGLLPQADGSSRLVFNRAADGVLHLTPSGGYTMSVLGGAAAENRLLCGLSGLEYIEIASGDQLFFQPGQPAAVTVAGGAGASPPTDVALRWDTAATSTTAWAAIVSGNPNGPPARRYFSAPDQAPWFARGSDGSKAHDHLAISPLSLTAAPQRARAACFPLLPYASVRAPPAMDADAAVKLVAACERQLFGPKRRVCIAAAAVAPASQAASKVTAVNPQGYVVTIVDGQWRAVQVVQRSQTGGTDVNIAFGTAAGAPLPDAVQDAFLTNQQFLVIAHLPDALKEVTLRATLDSWRFQLDLTKNKIGDYRSVLIFKLGGGTVSQFARHPEAWARGADFNLAGDKDGTYLSRWLIDYLDNAKRLYDGGRGVARLEEFCALIDDPGWTGFLALRAGVGMDGLPDAVKALAGGIDASLFEAHHFGSRLNHLTTGGAAQPYQLNSAVFALVSYRDPLLGAKDTGVPAFIPSPRDYDFKILTLEAAFENGHLENFASSGALLLNRLFGDKVVDHDRTGASAGRNNLPLIGSYNHRDGQAGYSFAMAAGAAIDFYLASNAFDRIRVRQVEMAATKAGDADRPGARFTLGGTMRFLAAPGFDLLSHDTLGFQALSLEMPPTKQGTEPAFVVDTSGLVLSSNLSQAVAAGSSTEAQPGVNRVRIGSLAAQFPLILKGFVTGSGDQLPTAQGFRALETTAPKDVPAATLASGKAWYGLANTINLGGQGTLGANGVLAADLLLAWAPDGEGDAMVAPYIRITGPGGMSLGFDIEGVIKFGAADVVLNKMKSQPTAATPDRFVLVFESIGLAVLMLSFPPKGTTNITLFGDTAAADGQPVTPTIAWLGGYAQAKAGAPQ